MIKFIKVIFLSLILFFSYNLITLSAPQSINFLEGNHIIIPVGQVGSFEIPDGIAVVVGGDKDIAEILVPPGQNKTALINAKKAGLTNVLIWTNKSTVPINFIIEVTVNSRMEQIITRVKVLEITKGTDGDLGIDWSDSITFLEAPSSMPFKFGLPTRPTNLSAKINMLLTDKKAKVLAEPTLVCMSGQKASFLCGGEIPSVISDLNKVQVTWKPYGISLQLEPVIVGGDSIQMTLTPEFSAIDKGNAVSIGNTQGSNTVIPAFTKRSASTTVLVKENESIVIAGLLRDEDTEIVNKLPLLGDIPVFGYLFSTNNLSKVKTELVFIVTPSILKPKTVMPESYYGQENKPVKPSNQ